MTEKASKSSIPAGPDVEGDPAPPEERLIHVRYRYETWHVEGASREYDLVFDDLADAERRAVQVARGSSAGVVVHAEDDSVIARHDHLG